MEGDGQVMLLRLTAKLAYSVSFGNDTVKLEL